MKLIFGNFKMNLTSSEIDDYINYFVDKNYHNVFFAPPSIYLSRFQKNNLNTVAQNVGFEQKGAFTGDISAEQLKSIGINYALVGHSERRKYYNDSIYVNRKIRCLLDEDITPILCIGESLEDRQNKRYIEYIKGEIDEAFHNINIESLSKIIIAYEPIWSIGTGLVPTNDEIIETVSFIKKYANEKYNAKIKVLYGGSVNNTCINTLEEIIIIDGYLVGGCSIKKEEFDKLIKQIK